MIVGERKYRGKGGEKGRLVEGKGYRDRWNEIVIIRARKK